jgi:hypothetical protein
MKKLMFCVLLLLISNSTLFAQKITSTFNQTTQKSYLFLGKKKIKTINGNSMPIYQSSNLLVLSLNRSIGKGIYVEGITHLLVVNLATKKDLIIPIYKDTTFDSYYTPVAANHDYIIVADNKRFNVYKTLNGKQIDYREFPLMYTTNGYYDLNNVDILNNDIYFLFRYVDLHNYRVNYILHIYNVKQNTFSKKNYSVPFPSYYSINSDKNQTCIFLIDSDTNKILECLGGNFDNSLDYSYIDTDGKEIKLQK